MLELVFASCNQDFSHSPLACCKSSRSSGLQHNFQWLWLRQFDLWKEWVWMASRFNGHRQSPGLLWGDFQLSWRGRQHRGWTEQGQGRIHVVFHRSAVSFLKESIKCVLAEFFEKDMTWTISKLLHQHLSRNLRLPIRHCGKMCQMLRLDQACIHIRNTEYLIS